MVGNSWFQLVMWCVEPDNIVTQIRERQRRMVSIPFSLYWIIFAIHWVKPRCEAVKLHGNLYLWSDMRSRCELIYMFAYWFIADYIILRSVNFNYANRLNPLKCNIPIFYHRFTAIKTNTVKSIETMDWWEWATVKSAWIINGRKYKTLSTLLQARLSIARSSPSHCGVLRYETEGILSFSR